MRKLLLVLFLSLLPVALFPQHSPRRPMYAASGSLAPSDVTTGQQAWYEANTESYVDNDAVGTLTDKSGNSRNLTQGTAGAKPTFKTSIVNGKSVYRFDGGDYATGAAISSFISNSAYTIMVVFKASSIGTNGASYANNRVFADSAAYFGLFLKTTGPSAIAYNWDGSDDNVSATISTGTFYLATMRHSSGTLYLQINQNTEVSIASGNTQVMTGNFNLGGSGVASSYLTGDIAELVIWNTSLSGANISGLQEGFRTKYALW